MDEQQGPAPSPPERERLGPAPSPPERERLGPAPSPPERERLQGIASLIRSIEKPTFRKSFLNDPLRAIERAGLDVANIPPDQLEVLAALSAEDLELLVGVTSRLRAAGSGRAVSI